jgi:hypothetical protein
MFVYSLGFSATRSVIGGNAFIRYVKMEDVSRSSILIGNSRTRTPVA